MSCRLAAMLILTSCAQVIGERRPLPEPPRGRAGVSVGVMIGGNGQFRRITLTMPAPPVPADEDDDPRPAQPVGRLNINSAVVDSENFDRWLFDDNLSDRARQEHLEDTLDAKVRRAVLLHKLTSPQKAKLRIAGKGDIKRFFDEVEGKRSEFEKDRQTYRTGRAALQRLVPLSQLYQDGPFGEGSLFAKTLHRINDDQKAGP
jgi:hypothetical protein